MDDDLIDTERLQLDRKSRLPGTGFFYPDSLDEERAERRAAEACEGAEAVVVADTDADGLACVALIRTAHAAAVDAAEFEDDIEDRLAGPDEGSDEAADDRERAESSVGLVGAGPHDLAAALERVADRLDPDAAVYVCDLCPDAYEAVEAPLEALLERASGVRWFDHHQWDDDVAAAVREAGVDLVVGDSETECTADVALRSLDAEFPDHLRELAAVTRDHDLWLKADDRSDDLADYAHWSDAEEYVAVVGEHGPALPERVREYLADRRVEKENLIERAVDRATLRSVGPWTVGVTYGRCSQNEVAEALREAGADASVVVKPAGSASIRGSESFARCHEVARRVNGGGHPKAAGCKPDIYDDVLDYAHHWTTEGATAKRVIVRGFEAVAAEVESGADGGGGDDAGEE
jgi:oligoribonuclease NrnB/cAMP/cGMP phosphodiesterase (DHH superfamily)